MWTRDKGWLVAAMFTSNRREQGGQYIHRMSSPRERSLLGSSSTLGGEGQRTQRGWATRAGGTQLICLGGWAAQF